MKERKRKLKPFVMPMVYALAFTALVLSLSVVDTIQNKQVSKADDNDTYMQNSGVLYKSKEAFDVVTILDGTVVNVKKDEVLGNIVEIKHSNNLITTYEGLSTVNVKKDQLLKQGDVIGKSGKLNLGEEIENGLLFEVISDGKYINPLTYLEQKNNGQ